jgi:hypothetical protein
METTIGSKASIDHLKAGKNATGIAGKDGVHRQLSFLNSLACDQFSDDRSSDRAIPLVVRDNLLLSGKSLVHDRIGYSENDSMCTKAFKSG